MVKHIEKTPNFIKKINKLDKSYLDRVEKLIRKIILDPEIGKPMMYGRKRTREVYISPFRLSYSYDKNTDILYLLDFYHKDEQ